MRIPFFFFGISLIAFTIVGFKMPLSATASSDKKSTQKIVSLWCYARYWTRYCAAVSKKWLESMGGISSAIVA